MLILLIFMILVALPVYTERKVFWERIDIFCSKSIIALLYSPIILLILIQIAKITNSLTENIGWLNIGWTQLLLGKSSNIALAPLAGSNPALLNVILSIIILNAFLIFNYMEEERFRDNNSMVFIWALLHPLAGVPLWVVVPLFFTGLIYKYIKDNRGLNEAYVAHVGTNTLILFLILLLGGS